MSPSTEVKCATGFREKGLERNSIIDFTPRRFHVSDVLGAHVVSRTGDSCGDDAVFLELLPLNLATHFSPPRPVVVVVSGLEVLGLALW